MTGDSAKAITAFSFQGLTPPVIGAITGPPHVIALTVPYGAAVTALKATFTTTGAAVRVGCKAQVSGRTANDFTSPVTYTVTAADASTQAYLVTVTVAPKPATKYLVTSSSYSPAAGAAVTISAQLADADGNPVATAGKVVTWTKSDVNGSFATATSTTNGSGVATVVFTTSATPGTVQTVTGTSPGPLTGVTGNITTRALAIGDSFGGGIVAYILQSSDPNYDASLQRGLIAAAADQSTSGSGFIWAVAAYQSTSVPGGTGIALGAGARPGSSPRTGPAPPMRQVWHEPTPAGATATGTCPARLS